MKYISDYINYQKLWDEIVEEYKEDLEDIDYPEIQKFIEMCKIPLSIEKCIYDSNLITFCFGEEYNTANESDTQNAYFCIYIVYNMTDEWFEDYYTEQG